MRPDLARQLFAIAAGEREITMADLEDGLRSIYRRDPMKAERAIGHMYGHAFKKREALYDARGGWPALR